MAIKLEHTEYGYVSDKKGWKYYCTVYMPDGTKWRPSTHGKTRRVAREKLDEKIRAKELELEEIGNVKEAEKRIEESKRKLSNTLAERLKEYATNKQKREKLKLSSINDKNELIRNLIVPYEIGGMQVDKIQRSDVFKWLEEMKERHSESRRKKAYNLLTDYYTNCYCNEVDLNFRNPAEGFRFSIKKSKADLISVLENDEAQLYLKTCDEAGLEADILQLMFYTYCRIGEAATLKWSDWNEYDILHIQRTWSRDENGKLIVDNRPKTPDSDRYIHLSAQVQALLTVRRAQVEGTEQGGPDAWIFPAIKDKSKPISESTVRNFHKRIMEESGLNKRLTPHGLRHSGISFNIRNTSKDRLSAISKQAGHSSRSITEDIYEHVLNCQLVELSMEQSEMYRAVCSWN